MPLSGRVLLGRYRSVRELARGGMGVVYLGRVEGAQGFAKPVVIKTILATGSRAEERARLFAREAHIVSRLQHPGIVAVIDFGQVDDSHVMVLEYVHGYNLAQWSRYVTNTRGPMHLAHAVHVVLAVLDALAYAHGLTGPNGAPLGIVHRDISPGNILIDVQGHVKLTDFGIARAEDDEFKTQEGMFRGTLPFLPPETLQGAPVDARADQYACAVVLYYLLTGVHPFKGAGTANIITRVLTHVPEPLSQVRPDVPAAIERAVTKAMSRNPDDRFETVAEFAEALRSGATWSERDAAREFAAQVAADFTGEMPKELGLEPLSERDAAWRDARSGASATRSSIPAPPRATDSDNATRITPPLAKTRVINPSVARAGRLQWFALAAVALLSALAAIALILRGRVAPKPIIVEKQSVIEAPAGRASAPVSAAPPPAEASTAVQALKPAASARSDPATPKNTLASAFQRRRGAIQRCFDESHDATASATRISVHFDVDRAGHVTSASLNPAAMATQPLGSCILHVARSTDFGAQPEAVSFSIPIAARILPR